MSNLTDTLYRKARQTGLSQEDARLAVYTAGYDQGRAEKLMDGVSVPELRSGTGSVAAREVYAAERKNFKADREILDDLFLAGRTEARLHPAVVEVIDYRTPTLPGFDVRA